jgi:hypothetical protein
MQWCHLFLGAIDAYGDTPLSNVSLGMERGVVKQAYVLIKCDAFFKYFVAHNRDLQSSSLRILDSSGSRFVTNRGKISEFFLGT